MLLDSTQKQLRKSREVPNYIKSKNYYEYKTFDPLGN